jgi:two-component system, NtrC family, sensor kinase
MINPFPTIHPIYGIYFCYGAAFLVLSFSIGMKNMKGSNLRLADCLWLLAAFGLVHGIHEIVGIYPLIEGEHLNLDEQYNIAILSIVLLIVSYMFLLQFGLSLSPEYKRKRMMWTIGSNTVLCVLCALFVWMHEFGSKMEILRQVEFGVRNTFGLFGGLSVAYGLITYSYSSEMENLPYSIARNIYYAGIVFAAYAFFTSSVFFAFARFLNIPPELFRGGTAALIAYYIIKALNIFDLETRKKVEDQARQLVQSEKLASLGRLAASIAHEINNPLTNASLGIQLLKSKGVNISGQAFGEQIDAVEKNIDRAAVIVRELLLFSRKRQKTFTSLNINDVIAASLALTKYKLKTVVLEQNLARVPDIMGDRETLKQVFINVLSNAVEAMPQGGRISISTMVRENMVEARIVDTGTGIAEEDLSRVLEPFFSAKEDGSGVGLGLFISYGIIQQHQGHIKITSTVGQGTTVSIQIPKVP